MQIYFIMRYIDRYNSIKVPYCIFCIYQRFLCKRTFQHKAFFSFRPKYSFIKNVLLCLLYMIKLEIWDGKKERKKDRHLRQWKSENELPQVGFQSTTLCTPGICCHQLSYQGSPAGRVQIKNLIYMYLCEQANVWVYIQRNLWWIYCTYMLYMLYILYTCTCVYCTLNYRSDKILCKDIFCCQSVLLL